MQTKNSGVSHGKTLWILFSSMLYISAFTFGGGFVIVSLMKKKFVNQLGWIPENEMLDLTAIAQTAPGPIAVNAAVLVGWRMGGFCGMLAAMLGTVLPPMLVLLGISTCYELFRQNRYVALMLKGMQAGVAAVILDVVVNMITGLVKKKRLLPLVILVGSFVASQVFRVNIILIILVCGLIGAVDTLLRGKGAAKA